MPNDPLVNANSGHILRICYRLKAARKQSGLTASVVAEHLNMPTALYVLYEESELVPHRLIPPLCELLDFSPWFYLTGKPDTQSPPFRTDK